MSEFLSRDAFLQAGSERKYDTVNVAGGQLRLRSLTESERAKQLDGWLGKKGRVANMDRRLLLRCRMLQVCAVDADGELLFSEDDIPQLAETQCGMIARAAGKVMELCGMTDDDVEEEVKNSETPDSDSSN